jgi:hypothetical protein
MIFFFQHISQRLGRSIKALTVSGMLLMLLYPHSISQITSVASNRWSYGTTWSSGTVPVAGDNVVIAGGHTVGIRGTSPGAFVFECNDLTITGIIDFSSSQARLLTVYGDLSGVGSIHVSSGVSQTLVLMGASNSIGTLEASTVLTVNYAGNNQSVFASDNYYNLILSGTATKTLQGNSTVKGDFTIEDGAVFDANSKELLVYGDWINNSTSDGFTETGSTIVFSGTAQTIYSANPAGETFENLTIDNTAGVTLLCDVTVTGTLTFEDCCIDLNGHTLTVDPANIVESNPPEAYCKVSYTVYLDADGEAVISPTNINNFSTVYCGSPILSLNDSSYTCADIGAVNVKLFCTDIYGVKDSCSCTLTIADTVKMQAASSPFPIIPGRPRQRITAPPRAASSRHSGRHRAQR